MKAAVDAKWMVPPLRGMGKYAHQAIRPIQDQIIFFQPQSQSAIAENAVCEGKDFVPWWEQCDLPKLCKREGIDLLICPYNTAPMRLSKDTKLVTVIHDLIFLQNIRNLPLGRSLYQIFGRIYRALVVAKVVGRSDSILTVSEFTKRELISKFALEPSKITVIPNSLDQFWFSSLPTSITNRQNYFLTVTGSAPSKNLRRTIQAFSEFKKKYTSATILKIAGVEKKGQAEFVDLVREHNLQDDVVFLPHLSDVELKDAYSLARGFIFASTFEGFGIPILEAMACGVPVACSNNSSMPEVIGGHGVLFDPFSVGSISEGFAELENCALWTDEKLFVARKSVVDRFSYGRVRAEFELFWKGLS
jgi:glycosyltransferase involved in cell wall biosynthesis